MDETKYLVIIHGEVVYSTTCYEECFDWYDENGLGRTAEIWADGELLEEI